MTYAAQQDAGYNNKTKKAEKIFITSWELLLRKFKKTSINKPIALLIEVDHYSIKLLQRLKSRVHRGYVFMLNHHLAWPLTHPAINSLGT